MTATHAELDQLRDTLQTLKKAGAFEGHVRLAFAADKTLRAIGQELQTYDEYRRDLLQEHSKRDGEGRKVWKWNGQEIVRDGETFVDAENDTEVASVDEVNNDPDTLQHVISDAQAYQSDMLDVANEGVSVDLHCVDEDVFFEHARLDGVHDRVDLSTLDPMLK